MDSGILRKEVIATKKATPPTRPTRLPRPVSRRASVMKPLKTSPPEAPIAIFTPTSRTRSFNDAIWMFTLTMPPPRIDRMPDSQKMML